MLSEGNFSQIHKNINDLKDKITSLEGNNAEKYKGLKKQMIELEERFFTIFVFIEFIIKKVLVRNRFLVRNLKNSRGE